MTNGELLELALSLIADKAEAEQAKARLREWLKEVDAMGKENGCLR